MNQLKKFWKLIINELYKAFFQKKTIVFLVLIIIAIFFNAFVSLNSDKGKDWQSSTKSQIKNLETTISEDKSKNDASIIDKNTLKMEEDQLNLLKYRLDHKLPDNVVTPYSFVYSNRALIGLIVIFMAIFSANVVANEYSWGTIHQLFIKPVKRWEVFVSKYLSSILVTTILCIIFFTISLIIGLILFGKNNASFNDVVLVNGHLVERNMILYVLLEMLSDIFSIAVISSLTFLIAVIVRSSSLAIIISIVIYFGGLIGGTFINSTSFFKYTLTPNLSLTVYLPGSKLPYNGASFQFSIVICIIYTALFLMSGIYIFNKRDVF
jgi:ABC-2 type transport system permease protein